MATKRKKPSISLDEVVEKKKCYCGKVFKAEENLNNIKKHFNACNSCKVRVDIRNWAKKQKVQPDPKPDVPGDDDSTKVIGGISDDVEYSGGISTGSDNVLGVDVRDDHDNEDIAIASGSGVGNDCWEISGEDVVDKSSKVCHGFKIFDTNEFYMKYPFAAHADAEGTVFAEFVPINGAIYSRECFENKFQTSSYTCNSCENLQSLNCVKNTQDRAKKSYHDDDLSFRSIPNKFLNCDQMIEKIKYQKNTIETLRLATFNNQKKIKVLQKKVAMHHRFVMALASKDVPRLRQLISVCIRQKRSISYIVHQLNKAINGLYSPKGYKDLDHDISTFVLLAGGPRLLNALHQTSGLPSLSTTYRTIDSENALKKVDLTITTIFDVESRVKENVQQVLKASDVNSSSPLMWSVKVDEIATEKRLRYKAESNAIFGLCATHSMKENTLFANIHVAEQLENALEEDKLHLATECCVFSLSSMGANDYHAKPFLSFPICSHDTMYQQRSIFEAVFTSWGEMWNMDFETDHMLMNFGTDGESVRRSVLHSFRKYSVDNISKLYAELGSLEYLDLVTGPLDTTFDFDAKHLSKRIRNNLLKGSIQILGVRFDAASLKVLLRTAGKYKEQEIDSMVNPGDKQNVPLAVKLLDALCEDFDSENLSPGLRNMIPALRILSTICDGILSLFARPGLSIHEALGNMSALSHVLLFLYSTNNINLPSVLYHDLQSTVQNAYFISAKYKIHCPDRPLFLYQVGSDQLEQLFSSVRTQNHDRGCDVYQLECRMKRAVILDKVLNKHPEWRQNSKRLSGPIDHTNPTHWTGDLICQNLTTSLSWECGKIAAKGLLPEGLVVNLVPSATILKPKGEFIGVTDGDLECELGDVEPEVDRPDAAEPEVVETGRDEIGNEMIRDEEETAFTEFEDFLEESNQAHEITISQGGHQMYKATVLRLITSSKGFKKSNDRLRRVAGYSKFISKSTDSHMSNDVGNPNLLTLKDTVATIVGTPAKFNLVIISIDGITNLNKEKLSYCDIDGIDNGSKITLTGKPLLLEPSMIENSEQLVWNMGEVNRKKEIKFLLEACSIICPKVENDKVYFSFEDLQLVFNALKNDLKTPLPKSELVYKTLEGNDFVLCKQPKAMSSDDLPVCHICQVKINNVKIMRTHIAKHIIDEEGQPYCCGFCGKPGCSVELKNTTHRTAVPMSNCKNYVKFSLKCSEKPTQRNPCTNRPVKCEVCDVVYWSYWLSTHYAEEHPEQSSCPVIISDEEKAWMDKMK